MVRRRGKANDSGGLDVCLILVRVLTGRILTHRDLFMGVIRQLIRAADSRVVWVVLIRVTERLGDVSDLKTTLIVSQS